MRSSCRGSPNLSRRTLRMLSENATPRIVAARPWTVSYPLVVPRFRETVMRLRFDHAAFPPRWHRPCSSQSDGRVGRGRKPAMNKDQIQGKWLQMKGAVKAQWGKLTNDDIDEIDGNLE